MIINRNNDYTEYICSLCGHKHIEYVDGRKENDPFIPYDRKIKVSKPIEDLVTTYMGKRRGSVIIEFDGYICPKCDKLQIDAIEYAKKIK